MAVAAAAAAANGRSARRACGGRCWTRYRLRRCKPVFRRGPLTMAPCQLGLFARSRPEVAQADLGYNVLAF